MNDTMKMFMRYAISSAIAYAAGRGWIAAAAAGPITALLLDIATAVAVAAPAIYAARNVSNAPLPKK